MNDNTAQTPLTELARSVPKYLRAEWASQWWPDGTPCGHSMAPVGKYLHDLANEVESLRQSLWSRDRDVQAKDILLKQNEDKIERLTTEIEQLKAAVLYLVAEVEDDWENECISIDTVNAALAAKKFLTT